MAAIPKTPKGAVAFVARFSVLTYLISWGFSLIFSGMLVREATNRIKEGYGLPGRRRGRLFRIGSRLGPRIIFNRDGQSKPAVGRGR